MSNPEITVMNLDGAEYDISLFSDAVKNAMAVFATFGDDLRKEELAVLKTKSAMDQVRMQLVAQVKIEIEERGIEALNKTTQEATEE